MVNYKIYNSTHQLPKEWDTLGKHNVFFRTPYLQALEEACPSNIEIFFVGVFKNQDLVGLAIVQRVQLYLKDMFRQNKVSCVKTFIQELMAKIIKGNILVVGNLTHTGQNGLFFKEETLSKNDFFQSLFSALSDIKQTVLKKQNKKIRAILLKDYFENDVLNNHKSFIELQKLHKVSVQPNMLLSVKPQWLQMEDYIASLNKKYRDRYKRAKKKRNGIMAKELCLEDIKHLSKALYSFYMNVSNNAKFNTFILPENHFYSLKLQLKDKFRVYGYYLNNELVGFYTLILNGNALETYFLGYDEEHQYPNQLYLNMLYDMLNFGIQNQFKTIVYARTAMEIKSSVGAKAAPMFIYLKHTQPFLNAILKPVFKLMNPTQDWHERHPFLDE